MAYTPTISLSPSSAKRWLNCTASPAYLVREHKRLPPTDTIFNIEGDQAHAVANAMMVGKPIPTHSRDKEIPKAKLPEMIEHAMGFINFCKEDRPWDWQSESKVGLFYLPQRNGYIDFVGIWPDRVRIVDLKYGKGVAVDAEHNEQMMIYARSVIEQELLAHPLWDIRDDTIVELSIYQPRVRDGRPISTWEISWAELNDHTAPIGSTAARIINNGPGLVFAPDDEVCRFCPAKTICGARNGEQVRVIEAEAIVVQVHAVETGGSEEKIVVPAIESLTQAQRLLLLEHRKEIKALLDDIHKAEYAAALTCAPPPGFKLVAGRGARQWEDPYLVQATLEKELGIDKAAPRDLISPNQAEVALKEANVPKDRIKEIAAMAIKKEGKATLVPESDPRPSLLMDSANLFENLDEEQLPEVAV